MIGNAGIISTLTFRHVVIVILIAVSTPGIAAKTKAGQGAKTGAAIGAGVGLLFGALTGDAGVAVAAAAVGAGAGAAEGAIEGWRQDQEDQRTRQITDAIGQSNKSNPAQHNAGANDKALEQLDRFVGVWAMKGWAQAPGGERINVTAKASGSAEAGGYVQLAYSDLKASNTDAPIWGASNLAYEESGGYSIASRFNTISEPIRAENGQFDQPSRSFRYSGENYSVVIRFSNPDRFTVETKEATAGPLQLIESYVFTRT